MDVLYSGRLDDAELRRNHLLSLLPDEDLHRIQPHLIKVELSQGQIIYLPDQSQDHAYFPTTSVIAYRHHDEHGNSSLVSLCGNMSMVGVSRLLQSKNGPNSAEVFKAGVAWRISAEALQREYFRGGGLMVLLLRQARFYLTMISQRLVCTQHHTTDRLLCDWLLYMRLITGSDTIETTQAKLAELFGIRRQTVSETFNRLQKDGVLTLGRGVVHLAKPRDLSRMGCGCSGLLSKEYKKLFSTKLDQAANETATRGDLFGARYLAQRVDLLETALDNSGISWWDIDIATGKNVQVGCDLWSGMLGYRSEEFNPGIAEWDALVHPDDQAIREVARAAHFNGETPIYECEYRIRHKNGHWIWLLGRGKVVARDANGHPLRIIGTNQDITARKQAELALEKLSRTDHLTQAANRMHFFEAGEREFARARRYGSALSLLSMDLDHFKAINDQYGHAAGDRVLQHFAKLIASHLRLTDVFARIGGEEFCLLLPHTDSAGAMMMAERILESVRIEMVEADAKPLRYTVSIGVAPLTADTDNLDAMLKIADRALYRAKNQGRNRAELAAAS